MLNMIKSELRDRLRVSGPKTPNAQIEEARLAINQGIDLLAREGNDTPSTRDVIWRLMQDAAETLHRMPDKEEAWQVVNLPAAWPDLARPSEECRLVEWEQSLEEAMGVRQPDLEAYRPRFVMTDPTAPRRMLVVLSWLRHTKSKNRKRDQLIFLEIARGMTYHRAARLAGSLNGRDVGSFAVRAIKNKMLRQIEVWLRSVDLCR